MDANGIPVGAVLSGANEHDVTMYQNCLASCVVRRPSSKKVKQHICLDKAYDSVDVRKYLSQNFLVHIPERNNRKKENKTRRIQGRKKARRWVVERTGSWHNKFRRLRIRYEQRAENYLAFVMFASAIICFRNI